MTKFDKVLEFARKAHEGQIRKNSNLPYITHPIAVKELCDEEISKIGMFSNENYKEIIYCVAMAHDLIENTKITNYELGNFLIDIGFKSKDAMEICHCVQLLTKNKENFDIIQYLRKISYNEKAKIVKLCDLKHNMSDLKPCNLLDKYRLCDFLLRCSNLLIYGCD